MQPEPMIDVLIPAYNAATTLVEAIGSIQNQTVRDIRIIVVNDGSTDDTAAVLQAIAAKDPRVKVVDTPNGGIVAALNTALSHATAPFVARHDADDIAFPDRFWRQLDYMERHPDCIAIGADVFHIDEQGRRTGWVTNFGGEVTWDATSYPAREPYLMHPFLTMRRDALVAVGGYRYVFHAEDSDLYWRLLGRGRLHNLEMVLGEYRVHAASISSSSVQNGRVAAAYAERAVISFRRRKAGEPDLDFPSQAREDLKSLTTIEDIVRYSARSMTPAEEEHFRLAVAAKLIENATYRPYLLELSDCQFIGQATSRLLARMDGKARRRFLQKRAAVLWRLLRKDRKEEARALRVPAVQYLLLTPIFFRQAKVKLTKLRETRRLRAAQA